MPHLPLPVELVVLSGCATGLNVVTPGDELMGLVRGLLQAGAQSLVLSLWDVHDDSTMEFMVEFYTRSEEHTSELQSHLNLVCRLLLEKKKNPRHLVPCYYGYNRLHTA